MSAEVWMNLQGGKEVVKVGKKMVGKPVKETIVEEVDMKVVQLLLKHFLSARRLYSWKNILEMIDHRITS